jgi:hypothetical protein
MPSVMPTFESLLKVSGISTYYYTCTCSFLWFIRTVSAV